jgi:hypothetical protein
MPEPDVIASVRTLMAATEHLSTTSDPVARDAARRIIPILHELLQLIDSDYLNLQPHAF